MGCCFMELPVLDSSVTPRWCIENSEYDIISTVYHIICYVDIEYYVPVNTCMEVGAWRCAKYSLDI